VSKLIWFLAVVCTTGLAHPRHVDGREFDWSGNISFQTRVFGQAPAYAGQRRSDGSIVLAPEFSTTWSRGTRALVFEGFMRWDAVNSRRTHVDIRELYWEAVWDVIELRVGMAHVFWGVTESQHLVDVVNQTDLVERADGESKLGQAMARLTLVQSWGTLDLYALPWFRKRTFPGKKGRLRSPVPVSDDVLFDSGRMKRHVSLAGRWSRSIDAFDVGLSHFWGTSRDPDLLFSPQGELIAIYDQIHQSGLELQAIAGGWLLKLEAINRRGQGKRFLASTAGFEYTFSNVKRSGLDIGVLLEYLWDEREEASSPFTEDLFFGTRVALNDVQSSVLLAGVVVDRTSSTTLFLMEASRRVGEKWKIEIEARGFVGANSKDDPFYSFRRDGHLEMKLARWF
jgi:hypothetical protein